jgi:hypothetical protein
MVTNNRNRLVTVVNIVIVGIERHRAASSGIGRDEQRSGRDGEKVRGMDVLPAVEFIANDGRSTVDG